MAGHKFPNIGSSIRVDGWVLVLVFDADTETYVEMGKYRRDELISSALFPELKVAAEALLAPD